MIYDPSRGRSAFETEALRWAPDVRRYAFSMTRDDADADDIVQETYLRALRAWRTFTGGTDCRRWLFTICRNAYLRALERRRAFLPLEEDCQDGGFVVPVIDERAPADLQPAIRRAIAGLPEPFRAAVIAVDVNDQPYDVAARALGVPVGTVRSRLFRGRRLLQPHLWAHAVDLGVIAPAGRCAEPH